jgi:hypothetical protein
MKGQVVSNIFVADILKLIFISVFLIGAFTLFRVKYLLRKYYANKHNEIFGKSLMEYNSSNSVKIVRFSLSRKEWEFVENDTLLFWLKIYRAVSITFYSIILVALLYMMSVIFIEVYVGK